MNTYMQDKLKVNIYATRAEMGAAAGGDIADAVVSLLTQKPEVNMIFAAAPSQNETLARLVTDPRIDWTRINAFHMDEYIGLPDDAPQRFGNFLKAAIFSRVPFRRVFYINGNAADIEAECDRYAALLAQYPTDIVCMGVGENGHIAFNDPPVADFRDPRVFKAVELDPICRNQQVNDGMFATLDEVPRYALTLTVSTLMKGGQLFCVVPAATKARAVAAMLNGDITEACPASILRRHDSAVLYCDADSASGL